MSEVLRHQLQEELNRDVTRGRHLKPAKPITKPNLITSGARHILLRVHEIELSVPELQPWDRQVYLKISIGQQLISRTSLVQASPNQISFEQLDIAITIDEDRFHREILILECFAGREVSEPVLLCDFRFRLAQTIQIEHINQRIKLVGNGSSPLHGEFIVECVVSADDEEHIRLADYETRRLIVRQRHRSELEEGSSTPNPKPIMLQQQEKLADIVAELRGDSSYFAKVLTAQLRSCDLEAVGCDTSDLAPRVCH